MADSSGGVTSFLFQGQPPIPVPTGSDTTTNFPLWLQTGIYDIANAGMNLAQQPFTPFPGQQVATPSQQTLQAWQTAGQNVGNYQPALNMATNLTGSASTPIGTEDINRYLNPYTQDVVGALQQASNKNLFENVLPQVQDQFVSAGQSKSPQQMEMTNRAIYNSEAALNPAVSQAEQTGFQGALNAAQQQKQMQQQTGAQMGQLGALQSQLGSYDIANLTAAGTAQDTLAQTNINAAINNFNQQQQWPYQNLGFVSAMLRGLPVGTTSQTATQTFPAAYGASPFATALGTAASANALGIGAAKGGHIKKGALGYAAGGRPLMRTLDYADYGTAMPGGYQDWHQHLRALTSHSGEKLDVPQADEIDRIAGALTRSQIDRPHEITDSGAPAMHEPGMAIPVANYRRGGRRRAAYGSGGALSYRRAA